MKPVEFGMVLKTARINTDLTISRLAEISGVSQPYLSQIENGKGGIPSPDILNKLHLHLNMKYSDLMRFAGYLPPEIHNPEDITDREEPFFYINAELTTVLRSPDVTFHHKHLSEHDCTMIYALIAAYLGNKMPDPN